MMYRISIDIFIKVTAYYYLRLRSERSRRCVYNDQDSQQIFPKGPNSLADAVFYKRILPREFFYSEFFNLPP